MKCSPGTTAANRPKTAAETHTSKKNMEFLLVTAPEKPLSNLYMHHQCYPHQLLSSATSLRHKQGASMLVLNLHEGYVLSLPTFSLPSRCGHLSDKEYGVHYVKLLIPHILCFSLCFVDMLSQWLCSCAVFPLLLSYFLVYFWESFQLNILFSWEEKSLARILG